MTPRSSRPQHPPSELIHELTLRAVEQVPEGRLVTYGDIAELVGTSARRVGAIMADSGGEVAWWRVTNRDGKLPEQLLPLARKRWEQEGIEHDGDRALIAWHRVDPDQLAADYALATDELTG